MYFTPIFIQLSAAPF